MAKSDREKIQEKKKKLIEMTRDFAIKYIGGDLSELCKSMILKMSRKRSVPFLDGRLENWAAAIVHAIGEVNYFENDKIVRFEDINEFFKTKERTVKEKSNYISKMFKLSWHNSEFASKANELRKPKTYINEDGFIEFIE